MTRQYPDHGTPAHFRARAASARTSGFVQVFFLESDSASFHQQRHVVRHSDQQSERQRRRMASPRTLLSTQRLVALIPVHNLFGVCNNLPSSLGKHAASPIMPTPSG